MAARLLMVVDSSVLLQILFGEPGAADAVRALATEPALALAAPTRLETEIVYGARTEFGSGAVGELCGRLGIEVVPFTAEHALVAARAYARFGKGTGHPAQLNFGDCVSYALAEATGRSLACKGDDFGHTDLEVVALG